MVGQFADSVFDNYARVESLFAITIGTCKGIGDQTGSFHTFYFIYESQDRRGDVNTVGYYFYCHVIQQINAFDCTFVLVLSAFVEAGHCIIEVGCMSVSGFISCTDIFKFGLCMCYGRQYAFGSNIFTELHGSREFRSSIPTLDAMILFYDRNVFIRIRIFNVFRNLSSCHFHVQVMTFEVQSQDRAVFLFHQLGTGFCSLLNHGDCR